MTQSHTWKNITIHLGPYYVMAGGHVLGQSDDFTLDIAETTDAEMRTLKNARIILLLKVDAAHALNVMKEHNNVK